jgi:AAA+ ATPase superfamily predicted ATPase
VEIETIAGADARADAGMIAAAPAGSPGSCAPRFLGRERELAALDAVAQRPGGQLVLLSGRRRIGKSYLLGRFAQGRRTLYFQATMQAEASELRSFHELTRTLADGVRAPSGTAFSSWQSAFDALVPLAAGERLIVVIDEFPLLCDATPELPSIVRSWWERAGRDSGVMLILSGSAQAFMESLDRDGAPLHGSFTSKIALGPFSYRQAARFTPALDGEARALVFGILGGTPYHLDLWNDREGVRNNLIALFADPLSPLFDAVEGILTTALADARVAFRVLAAIALGRSRFIEIHDYARVHERVLPKLIGAGLIERSVPATENPERTKRSVYRIPDPALSFYFRFIASNRGAIERGLGESVIDGAVLPQLDDHMSGIFKMMAIDFCAELIAKRELSGDRVGSWWSADGQSEVDLVGCAGSLPTFAGATVWNEGAALGDRLRSFANGTRALGTPEDLPRLLFMRRPAAHDLLRAAGLTAYTVGDLYQTA